jgi:phosphoribosylglycinamide formyltransferase-1
VHVAVLASGSGTILEAMFEDAVPVKLVVADRPCRALEVADTHGATSILIDREQFGGFGEAFEREDFTKRMTEVLEANAPDLVAMAGFGTVLTETVHLAFPGRILNTHPALLPAFPGWHAVRDALTTGVKVTGCTVHIATVEMDRGPILAQEAVTVMPNDTEESLHERIKEVERRLYPSTIRRVLDGLGR